MSAERAARLLVIGLVLGLPLAVLAGRLILPRHAVDLRARMAEAGGWTPAHLTAVAGEPLHLRLTSDDVIHGFAVGQREGPAVDLPPGQVVETTLTFDRPGTYTFYCTRWCGLSHWRMRGTIEVRGPAAVPAAAAQPLYVTLGLDIDAPHPAAVVPGQQPSPARGANLGLPLPEDYLTLAYYRAHSPVQAWQGLRREMPAELSDADVWNLVAFTWRANSTPGALVEGQRLYAANCAACHGETGAGDGVMAAALSRQPDAGFGPGTRTPVDFTDASSMLGASPALLQGKIIRGGMGTGMPYWGPIFTEAQTWALVDYLWTFQFGKE